MNFTAFMKILSIVSDYYIENKCNKTTYCTAHNIFERILGWFKHILLNKKNTLLTQIYKHFKQWIRTKDDDLIRSYFRLTQ